MEAGKDKIARQPRTILIDALLNFVNQNISNREQSPQEVAVHHRISPRYVQELFAGSALTLRCCVTARFVTDHISPRAASPLLPPSADFSACYRWGF